jgi:hypothetical protein
MTNDGSKPEPFSQELNLLWETRIRVIKFSGRTKAVSACQAVRDEIHEQGNRGSLHEAA